MTYLHIAIFFLMGFLTGNFLNRRSNGYMLLGGRCEDCGTRISSRYPVVELLTGAAWAAAYYHFGFTLQLFFSLFFLTMLILLSVIDYYTKIIPNKILLPAIAFSCILIVIYPLSKGSIPIIANTGIAWAVMGLLIGGGFLLLMAILGPLIFKKEVMGGGDIKLAAFMGLYLGGYVLLALMISSLLSTIVGLVLVAIGKTSRKDMMPFGPFLAMGSIITIFFGPQLLSGYLSLVGMR